MSKRIIILLCLLTFGFCAQSDLNFANKLYEQNDYERAITEYQRALFNEKETYVQDQIRLQLAEAYFHNGQREQAADLLTALVKNSNYFKKVAQYRLAVQYYKRGVYDLAALEFRDYYTQYKDDTALYLSGWAYFKAFKLDKAAETFALFENMPESNYRDAAGKLSARVEEAKSLKRKRIGFGRGLSLLIPGAGQCYAHNWKDGAVSFLLNGFTIALINEASGKGNSVEAALWLTLELAWYFGGALSAEKSVIHYNRNIRNEFIENLETEFQFEKLIEREVNPKG